jgi:hypothetical protein
VVVSGIAALSRLCLEQVVQLLPIGAGEDLGSLSVEVELLGIRVRLLPDMAPPE